MPICGGFSKLGSVILDCGKLSLIPMVIRSPIAPFSKLIIVVATVVLGIIVIPMEKKKYFNKSRCGDHHYS